MIEAWDRNTAADNIDRRHRTLERALIKVRGGKTGTLEEMIEAGVKEVEQARQEVARLLDVVADLNATIDRMEVAAANHQGEIRRLRSEVKGAKSALEDAIKAGQEAQDAFERLAVEQSDERTRLSALLEAGDLVGAHAFLGADDAEERAAATVAAYHAHTFRQAAADNIAQVAIDAYGAAAGQGMISALAADPGGWDAFEGDPSDD